MSLEQLIDADQFTLLLAAFQLTDQFHGNLDAGFVESAALNLDDSFRSILLVVYPGVCVCFDFANGAAVRAKGCRGVVDGDEDGDHVWLLIKTECWWRYIELLEDGAPLHVHVPSKSRDSITGISGFHGAEFRHCAAADTKHDAPNNKQTAAFDVDVDSSVMSTRC